MLPLPPLPFVDEARDACEDIGVPDGVNVSRALGSPPAPFAFAPGVAVPFGARPAVRETPLLWS